MCYSNLNDIIHSIIDMDADVIMIENSQSDEQLLSVFREGVKYGADTAQFSPDNIVLVLG
ncbi:hypothetical protein ZIOFF_034987 [Zingiber officinale]|uniref:Cobalamin-independent methionine synthase MetE C-terminal/archaeal domain-containing protein n=1 Tax=Zingiber officinale TaxID=94328 RepID=A0A8J5G989_ZINOF|nr:hypothetical protein ZIOFF_034987 [Zingiber officinale]